MKLFSDLEVGAATHTGRVRRTNEDDYLVLMPDDVTSVRERGRLLALADGMGGVTGGAEASRAATRALAETFLAQSGPSPDPEAVIRAGFRAATQRVFDLSRESPGLRGMGTTLTVLHLVGTRVVVGHVGDSRCYLLRDGSFDQLTEDHALRGRENRLTRCIGGGRATEEVDVIVLDLRVGDRFLLASDGLWDTVSAAEMQRAVATMDPQSAADELVKLANESGGPDNSTAVVLEVLGDGRDLGHLREVALPAEEAVQAMELPDRSPRLQSARWPWLLLLISAILGGLALAKANEVDLVEVWRRWTG